MRTAIVAPIDLPPDLARLREPEVEVARRGVPPHITILSPFLDSSAIDAAVHRRLAAIASGEASFEVAFRSVRRWPTTAHGPGVVWLAPEPAEPFVRLTRAVWAAWPETPPYGRVGDDLQPHLTMAIDRPAEFDGVEREAAALVPFRRTVGLSGAGDKAPSSRPSYSQASHVDDAPDRHARQRSGPGPGLDCPRRVACQ